MTDIERLIKDLEHLSKALGFAHCVAHKETCDEAIAMLQNLEAERKVLRSVEHFLEKGGKLG